MPLIAEAVVIAEKRSGNGGCCMYVKAMDVIRLKSASFTSELMMYYHVGGQAEGSIWPIHSQFQPTHCYSNAFFRRHNTTFVNIDVINVFYVFFQVTFFKFFPRFLFKKNVKCKV